jgi:hypothetical protein
MARKKSRAESITNEDCAALTAADIKQRHTRRTATQKVEQLARVIANAVTAFGAVTESDLTRGGFSLDEVKALYSAALERARRIEPNLDSMVLS